MVERAATPRVTVARRLLSHARAITTPLLPDDYLALFDRRWSAREQTGTIVEVRRLAIARWVAENGATVDAYNDRLDARGLWNADLRKLRGTI